MNSEKGEEPDLLGGLITAAALDAMEFAPLVEHVPSLVVEGYGILAGSPKIGKSWLAAAVALACSQGGVALDSIKVPARHVLLLALEDGNRRLQSRMRFLNHEAPLPERLHIITNVKPITFTATVVEWLELHRDDDNPPLVILDTLGKVRPRRRSGDEPYQADYDFGSMLKELIDNYPGATLLAVHHKRKTEAEDWLETVGGSQGVTAAADYIMVLSRKRKSVEGVLAVTGRDIQENEYAMVVDNGRWRLDGPDVETAASRHEMRQEQERLGDRALEVLAFVNGRSETRAADVTDELGINQDQARVYLNRLADSGRITKSGRGLYTPVMSVMSVTNGNETLDTDVTHTLFRARPKCQHCGDELMHPKSVERGCCSKPACLRSHTAGDT